QRHFGVTVRAVQQFGTHAAGLRALLARNRRAVGGTPGHYRGRGPSAVVAACPGRAAVAAQSETLLRCLRRLAVRAGADDASDAALLGRFLADRDDRAFAALVDRHAELVLQVCWRILGDVHDAEDAFQATFLVLARKAAAVRPREALPAWLHGV